MKIEVQAYGFTDGKRIMPAAHAKEGLQKLQILFPIFLLKSQAKAYYDLRWKDNPDIKIVKIKVIHTRKS